MKKLSGVITALMTLTDPFGAPDLEGTLSFAQYSVEGGVNGLFISGTNGEGLNFSISQRLHVAEKIIKGIDRSRAMICIHTGASRLEETIELTRGAYELGADCAAIITPAFIPYEDDELYHYYCSISKNIPEDFPLYLYNIPPRTGNDIKPEVARRIFNDCKNVVGIKASFCELDRTLEYLSIDGISMLQGSDVFQLEYLAMDCEGIISGLSGVYPVPFVQVRKAWLRGDIDAARKWQNICYEVCKALNCGNVGTMKRAMSLKGFPVYLNGSANTDGDLNLAKKLAEIDAKIEDMLKSRLEAV